MSIKLTTGVRAQKDIYPRDDAGLWRGLAGTDTCILAGITASVSGNVAVDITAGEALMQGRHYRIVGTETVTTSLGQQGSVRVDVICAKYSKLNNVYEQVELVVIEGTPGSSTPPSIPGGVIDDGAPEAYMALFQVNLDGYNISSVKSVATYKTSLVESGTVSGWTYHKYNDGTFAAWLTAEVDSAFTSGYAGGYTSARQFSPTVPSWATSVTSADCNATSYTSMTKSLSTRYGTGLTSRCHLADMTLAWNAWIAASRSSNVAVEYTCHIRGTWA